MRVFITDLSAYNQGHLIGKWIELPLDPMSLEIAINEVLGEGTHICNDSDAHEEIFITDHEEVPFGVGEYDDIYEINQQCEAIDALDDYQRLQYDFLIYEGCDHDYAMTHYEDVTIYDYSGDNSFTDVYEMLAYDLVEEGCFGEIPEHLSNYIDYSAIGRDLSYDYTEFEHGILGRAS